MSANKEKAYPWQLNWQQAEQHVPNRHLLKGFAPPAAAPREDRLNGHEIVHSTELTLIKDVLNKMITVL